MVNQNQHITEQVHLGLNTEKPPLLNKFKIISFLLTQYM